MAPKRKSTGAAAAAASGDASREVGGSGRGGGEHGPTHRHCFLQAMMARQYVKEAEAKALFRQITGATHDGHYLHFLAEINQQLNFAQFELRRVKYPGDGEWYLGYVNREADEVSKRSVKYRVAKDGKPDTRVTAYFRALLDQVVAAATAEQGLGFLTSQQALYVRVGTGASTQAGEEAAAATQQQAEEVGKLSLRDREAVLAQLTTDGWLAHVSDRAGCYTLGPRSFLELSQALDGLVE
ncbi:hypothetical protein ACK3TF_001247 [Chlorella vulgaris]